MNRLLRKNNLFIMLLMVVNLCELDTNTPLLNCFKSLIRHLHMSQPLKEFIMFGSSIFIRERIKSRVHLAVKLLALMLLSLFWTGCQTITTNGSAPTLETTGGSVSDPSGPNIVSSGGVVGGPHAGSLMSFADGSVLVFVPNPDGVVNNGQKGFWMTLSPITNYQFSLCVQSGKCQLPVDSPSLNAYNDPNQENSSLIMTGVDIADAVQTSSYCGWMQGRAPNEKEKALFADVLKDGLQNENVHFEDLGLYDAGFEDLGLHNVRFEDLGLHNVRFDDLTQPSLRCVVDSPRPMPMFVQSSPSYDPDTLVESMTAEIASSTQFCQDGIGYQTLDLTLIDEDNEPISLGNVASVGGTECQIVDGNRVACYGNPGSSQIKVGLVCDGKNSLVCQPGSTLDAAGCQNNLNPGAVAGLDDWLMNANGVLVPSDGKLVGAAIPNLIIFHGVMVSHAFAGDSLFGGCPSGYYFDQGAQGCASLGEPLTACLDGYEHAAYGGCKSTKLNGNYPGCPTGEVFDPVTGLCDPTSKTISSTAITQTTLLTVELPTCNLPTGNNNNGSSDGSSNGSDGGSASCTLTINDCYSQGLKNLDMTTCSCN